MRTCVICGKLDKEHLGTGMICPPSPQYIAVGVSHFRETPTTVRDDLLAAMKQPHVSTMADAAEVACQYRKAKKPDPAAPECPRPTQAANRSGGAGDWSKAQARAKQEAERDETFQFLIDENVKLRDEIERLRRVLRNIVECDELACELYTSHESRADNFADKARAALKTLDAAEGFEMRGALTSVEYGKIWGVECQMDQQAAENVLGVKPVQGMPLKVAVRVSREGEA